MAGTTGSPVEPSGRLPSASSSLILRDDDLDARSPAGSAVTWAGSAVSNAATGRCRCFEAGLRGPGRSSVRRSGTPRRADASRA